MYVYINLTNNKGVGASKRHISRLVFDLWSFSREFI